MFLNIQSLDPDDEQSHETIIYMNRFDHNSVIIRSLQEFNESSQIATKHNFNDFNLYHEYEIYIKKIDENQNKSIQNSEVSQNKNEIENAPAVIEKEKTSPFMCMFNESSGDVIFITQEIHLSFYKYHMLIAAEDESFTCLFCDDKIDGKEECKQHVETEKHKTHLQNQEYLAHFTDNIIRCVKDNVFHCGICNITVTDDHLTAHVQKDINHTRAKHNRQSRYDSICETIKYGQDYPFSDRTKGPNGEMLYYQLKVLLNLFHYNMLIPNGDDTYVCLCCNVNIDTMSECRKHVVTQHHRKHLRGQQYIKEFSNNIVRRIQDKYFHCGICNNIILEEHMANHVQNEKKHETLKKYSEACALHVTDSFFCSNTEIDLNDFIRIQIRDEHILMPKYRWHMCFKFPRKFFCSLCILDGDVELLEDHLKSCDHLTRLGKCQILLEYGFSVVRTLNQDYYHCGVCNLHTNIPIINSHIKNSKHKSYVKLLLELNRIQTNETKTEQDMLHDDQARIKIQETPEISEQIVIDSHFKDIIVEYNEYKFCLNVLSYNTIVKANNDFYCVCCFATVHDCELDDHINMEEHKEALDNTEILDEYVDNFVRKIHSETTMWAHCGFCNTRMTYNTKNIEDHFKTSKHVENSIHRLELLAKNVSEMTKNYKLMPKKFVPPTAQYSKSEIFSYRIEILGHKYQLNLHTYKAWHTIRGWGMYFHCCFVCQTLLTQTTMNRHTRSTEHKENLKKCIILECYGTHYLKLIDWTDTVYCMLCNEHIDNLENGDIDSHITSQRHINKHKIGVTKLGNRDEIKSRIPLPLQNLLDAKILKPESKNEQGYEIELKPESKNEKRHEIELEPESKIVVGYVEDDICSKENQQIIIDKINRYEIELKPESKNEERHEIELKPESKIEVGYKRYYEYLEDDICSKENQLFAPVRISEDDSKNLDILIARISHILKVDAYTPEDLAFLTLADKAQFQHFNIICEIIDKLKNNVLIQQIDDGVNGKIAHIDNLRHDNLKLEVIEYGNRHTSKYLILDFVKEKMLVTYNAWNTIIEQNNYCRSCHKYFKTDLKGHCSEETHIDKAFGRIIKLIDGSPGRHVSKNILHCILCDSEVNWLSLNCHIKSDTHLENFTKSKDAVRYVDKSQVKSFPYERCLVSAECTQMKAGKCKEGNLVLLRLDHTEMVVTYEAWNWAKENVAICYVCNDRSTKSDRRDIVTHCNNGSHRHEMNSKPTIDNCIRQIKKNKFQCFLCDFYGTRVQIKIHVQMTIHEDNIKVARILGEILLNSGIPVINYAQNTNNDIYANNIANIDKIKKLKKSKIKNTTDNAGSSDDDDSDYCNGDSNISPGPTTIETVFVDNSMILVKCNMINKVNSKQVYENKNSVPSTSREDGYTKMGDLQVKSKYNMNIENVYDSDTSDSKEMLIINRSNSSTDDDLKEIKLHNKTDGYIRLQDNKMGDLQENSKYNRDIENVYDSDISDSKEMLTISRTDNDLKEIKLDNNIDGYIRLQDNKMRDLQENSKCNRDIENVYDSEISDSKEMLTISSTDDDLKEIKHDNKIDGNIRLQDIKMGDLQENSKCNRDIENVYDSDISDSKEMLTISSTDDDLKEIKLDNNIDGYIRLQDNKMGNRQENSKYNRNIENVLDNDISDSKEMLIINRAIASIDDYSKEIKVENKMDDSIRLQDDNVIDANITKLNSYGKKICPLCNMFIPTQFHMEHVNSKHHKNIEKLTEIVLERVKNSISHIPSNIKNDDVMKNVKYCSTCNCILSFEEFSNHNDSLLHKNNVNKMMVIQDALNHFEQPSSFNTQCVNSKLDDSDAMRESKSADDKESEVILENDALLQQKQSTLIPITAEIPSKIVEDDSERNKNDINDSANSTDYDEEAILIDLTESEATFQIGVKKMKINKLSYFGIRPKLDHFWCVLCQGYKTDLEEHLISDIHTKRLNEVKFKGVDLIRYLTNREAHCAVCHLIVDVTKLKDHLDTEEHKIKRSVATLVPKNESTETENSQKPRVCDRPKEEGRNLVTTQATITNEDILGKGSILQSFHNHISSGIADKSILSIQNQSSSIGFHNQVLSVNQPPDIKATIRLDSNTRNMSITQAKPCSSTSYICTVCNIEVPSANEKIPHEKSLDHINKTAQSHKQSVTKIVAQSPSTSINQIVILENSSETQPPLKTVIQNEFISFNVESKDYSYLCSLCNAKLISKHVEYHLKSSRHMRNLRSLNLKSVNTPNTQNQSPSIGFHNEVPTVDKPLDVKTTHKFDFITQNMSIIEAKPCSGTSYFCAVCNIEVPSANEITTHEKSLDHIINSAAQSVKKSETQSPSLSINHTAILDTSSKTQPPFKASNENKFITVNSHFNDESYSCSLCDIQTLSLSNIEDHLKSSRHMTNLKVLSSKCDNTPNVKTNNKSLSENISADRIIQNIALTPPQKSFLPSNSTSSSKNSNVTDFSKVVTFSTNANVKDSCQSLSVQEDVIADNIVKPVISSLNTQNIALIETKQCLSTVTNIQESSINKTFENGKPLEHNVNATIRSDNLAQFTSIYNNRNVFDDRLISENYFVTLDPESKLNPYFCSLCKIPVSSLKKVRGHLRGLRHAQNLKNRSLVNQSTQNIATRSKSSPASNLLKLENTHEYACEACNVKVPKNIWMQHVQGRNHRLKLTQITQRVPIIAVNDIKNLSNLRFKAKTTDKPKVETNTPVYNTKQIVSLIKGAIKNKVEPQHKCVICKVNVPLANLEEHNRGRNHIKNKKQIVEACPIT